MGVEKLRMDTIINFKPKEALNIKPQTRLEGERIAWGKTEAS